MGKRIDYDDENDRDIVMIMVANICLTGTVMCFLYLPFLKQFRDVFFTMKIY